MGQACCSQNCPNKNDNNEQNMEQQPLQQPDNQLSQEDQQGIQTPSVNEIQTSNERKYLECYNENEELKNTIANQSNQIAKLEFENQNQQEKINLLNESIEKLRAQLIGNQRQLAEITENQVPFSSNEQYLKNLEDAFIYFQGHMSIYIYFSCQQQPQCIENSLIRPFIHQTCQKKAKFHFNGRISCEGDCESYAVTSALFYCKERSVCSKKQMCESIYSPETISSSLQFSQMVQNGLDKSEYSEEQRLKFQNLLTKFPFYWNLMLG